MARCTYAGGCYFDAMPPLPGEVPGRCYRHRPCATEGCDGLAVRWRLVCAECDERAIEEREALLREPERPWVAPSTCEHGFAWSDPCWMCDEIDLERRYPPRRSEA